MTRPPRTHRVALLYLSLLCAATPAAPMPGGVSIAQAQPADSIMPEPAAPAGDSLTAIAPSGAAGPVIPVDPRNFYHVFAAFGVAWALILGYGISLGRRLRRLEEELPDLRP